jgi:hypothetical protein
LHTCLAYFRILLQPYFMRFHCTLPFFSLTFSDRKFLPFLAGLFTEL